MAQSGKRSRFSRALRRARLRFIRLIEPVFGPLRRQWERSLMVRTMATTGVLTGLIVIITGAILLASISTDLYSSRKSQSLNDAARATLAAQRFIDAYDAADRGGLSTLSASVRRTVQDTSASQMIYVRRQPGQAPFLESPQEFNTNSALMDAVTPELAESLSEGQDPQYVQPVTFIHQDGTQAPGLVVASTLVFPAGAGTYDLYIGYDLSDTQETLAFVQRTFLLAAVGMMLLIGALVWTMSRIVFRPIRLAAEASKRVAGGDIDARMPRQNDHYFDQLSKSFNEMADTIQARIRELDELSAMQQRFVSDVSHELRTPLTTIRLASAVLQAQRDSFDPAQQRAVEVMETQLERFESLLADLLEISRYDAGHVTLERESTKIVPLVEEIADQLRPLSSSLIEVRPIGGYTPIEVDARRIRRIVSNLIGNAIEHGEGKPVVITVDSNESAVAVTVRDWGVGMSSEALEHVFDRFWRADPSRKRTLGGTGLGLAIALEDATAHQGSLEAWSAPGEGSNFRLTLPRSERSAAGVSPLPLVPEDAAAEGTVQVTGNWLKRKLRRVAGIAKEDRA